MEIEFSSSKLQKIFNSQKELIKKYGAEQARKIMVRMKVLEMAENLSQVPPEKPDRRHQLKGNLKEHFAVDLSHPYRLIFKPSEKTPFLSNGQIDLAGVKAITIVAVEDYHGD